jgi:hypothetical protein
MDFILSPEEGALSMTVKVIVKGKKEPEKSEPRSAPPETIQPIKKKGDFYILARIKKMVNIMILDVHMKFNKKLKREYEDYARFAELARRKQ